MSKAIQTPLFWDLHIHGVGGFDFMYTSSDSEFLKICSVLGEQGIGHFAPTLLTSDPKRLEQACKNWGRMIKTFAGITLSNKKPMATPIGLHLEGPFLSHKMSGAHPQKFLDRPTISKIKNLVQLSQNSIAIVTIAPELNGAVPVIRYLTKNAIRVQLGHSVANAAQIQQAIRAGASGITHLFNAMPVHHRTPGLLSAFVRKQVESEIITDSQHIHPDMVLWAMAAVPDQIYAVSDGCSATGAKSLHCTLGSLQVKKNGLVAKVTKPTELQGTLAGGATYLTQHPELLWRSLAETKQVTAAQLLRMFWQRQKMHFKSPPTRFQNQFDPHTLRFLGVKPQTKHK